MNFLALAQRASFEAGLQGTGPSAVTQQVNMNQHFVDWTRQAWIDIQLMRNWTFMRKSAVFNTAIGDADYTLADIGITDWREWIDAKDQSKIGETTTDETELQWMTYADYQTLYGRNALSSTRPTAVTLLEDESIKFNAIPDKAYSVTLPYLKAPQTFSADGDTPTGLAEEYHMIIVWKTLEAYALFDQSPDVMARYQSHFPQMFTRMRQKYLPKTRIVPSALA
jgi:hypothetical protein